MAMFLVLQRQSGPEWRDGEALEDQTGWDQHAEFMDALAAEGFVVLGGPVGSERRVALAVRAASESAIRETLAKDPWTGSHLEIESIEPWTIRLEGRR